jgi:mRNA deadenylase 3'-5' endonuclease subunit Ccr4
MKSQDEQGGEHQGAEESSVSVLTFNVLAPCYARLPASRRFAPPHPAAALFWDGVGL